MAFGGSPCEAWLLATLRLVVRQVSLNIDTDRHAVEPTVPIKQLCEILALVDCLGCDPGGIDRFTPRALVGRLA